MSYSGLIDADILLLLEVDISDIEIENHVREHQILENNLIN